MGASFEVKGNILFIRMWGELDHHLTDALREEADRKIGENNILHLIFDYEKIAFMDSSGIGFVMGRFQKIRDKGGKAVIIGTNPYADKIFEMSGIYQIMRKCPDQKEAEGYLKGER